MSDWDVKNVSSLIEDNILFAPIDGNHGERHPKSSDYVDDGIPFIMASDIKNGNIDFSKCKFIKKSQADKLIKGKSYTDDVLLTHKATLGNTAILKSINYEYIMLTPQVTYYRIKDKSKLNNIYLKYYFETSFFQTILNNWGSVGGTRSYIGIEKQRKLPVILPPISTQKKIADILSAYDDLIENNNKSIALLEKAAQDLYKEWFVRFRFPGHENVKLEKGLPEGWCVKKLSDFANIIMGQSPSSEYYNSDYKGLPFHQGVSHFNKRFPSHNIYCTLEKKIACKGSILLSVRAPVGRINIANEKIIIGRGLCAINHKLKFNSYLYYLLSNFFYVEDIIGNGSIFNSVNKEEINKIKIFYPDIKIIKLFEDKVKSIDNQLEVLYKKNLNLKNQRDLLLPRLMSGKLKV